jgi:tol-pal system protein YbgF
MRHICWVLLATVGCATPMSAMREDNHRLAQDIADLRADRRAADRKLKDLEHQLALAKEKQLTEAQVPPLPVEVVAPPASPDGQRLVAVADDGSEIVYEGDAALGKVAPASDVLDDDLSAAPRRADPEVTRAAVAPVAAAADDRIEVTRRVARIPRTRARSEPSPSADGAGTEYRTAVELVKTGKYDDAITALRAFLQHYPRHDYADNAQYWLGEAFYAQKDFAHALVEFRATIETYPRGNKVPDALLKVGYCYQSLGKSDKARAVLEQVVNLYPKSEPAALAAKRLETP